MNRKTSTSTTVNSNTEGTKQYKTVNGTIMAKNSMALRNIMNMPGYCERYWGGLKAWRLANCSSTCVFLPLFAKLSPFDRDPWHTLPRSGNKTRFRTCSLCTRSRLSSTPRSNIWDICGSLGYAWLSPMPCLSDKLPHVLVLNISDNAALSIHYTCLFFQSSGSILCSPSIYMRSHLYYFGERETVHSYRCEWWFQHPAICRWVYSCWVLPGSPPVDIWLC